MSTTPPSYLSPEYLSSISSRDTAKKVSMSFRITGIAPQPVELWNTAPRRSHHKPYYHRRQQATFQAKEETRTDEEDVVGDDDEYQHPASSRSTALEESRIVPPMDFTLLDAATSKVVHPTTESTMLEKEPNRVVPPPIEAILIESIGVVPPSMESSSPAVLEKEEEESTTKCVTAITLESTIQSFVDAGCHHYALGHYKRAESDFQNALQICPSRQVAAILYGNLGATYLQLGNFKKANMYLQKCWHWKNQPKKPTKSPKADVVFNESSSMTDLCLNLGNGVACENLQESVYWYQRALEDVERDNQGNDQQKDNDKANILFHLGRVFAQHQQWENAKTYLEQTYAVSTKQPQQEPNDDDEKHQNLIMLAETCDLLGLVYMAQGKYGPAMSAFRKAMAVYRCSSKSPIHQRSIAQSWHNIGLLHETKGELSDAWEAYTTAQELMTRWRAISQKDDDDDDDDLLLQMINQSIHTVEHTIANRMQRKVV